MTAYGLLIDYEYCTGCQSCEVSCKMEHDFPVGKWGIRVFDDGPWEIDPKRFNCGREPICVHHCLANVMHYGPVEELAAMMDGSMKKVLFVPTQK